MPTRLSSATSITPDLIATAALTIDIAGEEFFDITGDVRRFLSEVAAGDGALLVFLRHTSASLVIEGV